jgi:hypothetical protein
MRLNVDLGPEAVAEQRTVFALSPNGRRIVFIARTSDGKQVLATRQLDQAKADLLRGTEGAADPFFSPDSGWIGFFADSKLKKVSVQGGAAVTLSEATPNPRGASWGEDDGIVLAVVPSTGLSRIPASGGAAQVLTNPAAKGQVTHRWPQILPGGRTAIFTAHTSTTRITAKLGGCGRREIPSWTIVLDYGKSRYEGNCDLEVQGDLSGGPGGCPPDATTDPRDALRETSGRRGSAQGRIQEVLAWLYGRHRGDRGRHCGTGRRFRRLG